MARSRGLTLRREGGDGAAEVDRDGLMAAQRPRGCKGATRGRERRDSGEEEEAERRRCTQCDLESSWTLDSGGGRKRGDGTTGWRGAGTAEEWPVETRMLRRVDGVGRPYS